MKIGILTFHWATNYGAVLQCYALQSYLQSIGHEVYVINYKPRQWATVISKLIHTRTLKELKQIVLPNKREKSLTAFRSQYINLSKRLYTCSQVAAIADNFDIIITGSDQVLSTSFLQNGDGKNKFTPTYYLGFPFKGRKIAYAVSFGCTTYPLSLRPLVQDFIADFSNIGVREISGLEIMNKFNRSDAQIVPDPTTLLDASVYIKLAKSIAPSPSAQPYTYCFFIRHIAERLANISKSYSHNTLWNNDDNEYSLEGWLSNILNAEFVITDSFHCVMMCLKLHRPFVVVTEHDGNVEMNDRLYTLLTRLELSSRILHKSKICNIEQLSKAPINWENVDIRLSEYRELGEKFLVAIK